MVREGKGPGMSRESVTWSQERDSRSEAGLETPIFILLVVMVRERMIRTHGQLANVWTNLGIWFRGGIPGLKAVMVSDDDSKYRG